MSPTFSIPDGAPHQTYYEILQITPSHLDTQKDPSQALKRAYHRALLIHHPDKRKHASAAADSSSSSSITIDQISLAYATLSSPTSRSQYDRFLLTRSSPSLISSTSPNGPGQHFQTGIQDVDLDDLDYDPVREEWFRSCRCGNNRGYRFEEGDLEEAADFGEVMVGCQDCSLWLRVRFAVVDDDEDGNDGREGNESQHENMGRDGSGWEKARGDGS